MSDPMSLATKPLHQWLEDPALIFNALPDGLALLDSNGYIRFLNTSWRHPTFAVGKSCLECFQSLAVLDTIAEQQMAEGVQAILKGNQLRVVMEYRVGETSSAGVVMSWFSLTMLPYPTQESRGVLIQQQDITERKRIETQLRKNTDHAELLVEISYALDEEGRNHQAVLDTIAHRVTLLLGDACMIRLLSDDRQWLVPVAWYHPDPTIREMMWQAMISTPQYAYEYLGGEVVRTGQPILLSNLTPQDIHHFFKPAYAQYLERFRVFSMVSVPLRAQGNVIGIITAFRNTGSSYTHEDKLLLQDISERAALAIVNARLFEDVQRELAERKQAQEELHKNQQLLHSVISNVPIILFAIEKHGIITLAEGKGLSLIDEPRTLVGMSYQAAFHDQPAYRQHIASVLGGGEEAEVLDIRGKPFDVRSLPLVDDVGMITGMISVATDYTEHMRVEEAQREAIAAAQAATQAKSEFLANMSHEIRTPMNAIIGMTNLLLDTVLTTEQQEFVETVHTSSSTLLTIINDILDFSKIEAGKLNLEYYPFDLRQCLEESLDLFATEATEKKLDLVYFIEDSLPTMISGDATRLRQILVNLLSNAVKFTEQGEVALLISGEQLGPNQRPGCPHPLPLPPPGGEGEIASPSPYMGEGAGGEGKQQNPAQTQADTPTWRVQVSVRDNGIGISPNQMNRLFQSFSQADTSTTRKYGGTGLGLTISKRLAELMGGTMWVESEAGQGSTFSFTFVAKPAPHQDTAYLETAYPLLHNKRLLILTKNVVTSRLLVQQSRQWGLEPVATSTRDETLQWLHQQGGGVDAVVIDLWLEEYELIALATAIQQHTKNPPLPLIVATSLGATPTMLRTSDLGIVDFLSRPVKPLQLLHVLINLFDRPLAGGENAVQSKPLFGTKKPLSYGDPHMGRMHPLSILLAEDNAVNQKVALRLLEKMGYRADIAANGEEVLEALRWRSYDVIFMDVQMPEMDGIEVTRRIRANMGSVPQPHIIAMTAYAMEGDRQRCLDAGMHDYVSKPVKIEEMMQALLRAANQHPSEEPIRHEPAAEGNTDVIDENIFSSLLAAFEEDAEEIVRDLVATYLEDTPRLLAQMDEAVIQDDLPTLIRAVHSMKSSSAQVGALTLSSLCKHIEKHGKEEKREDVAKRCEQVHAEFARVDRTLRQMFHLNEPRGATSG